MSLQLDLDKVENYLEKSNGDIRLFLSHTYMAMFLVLIDLDNKK